VAQLSSAAFTSLSKTPIIIGPPGIRPRVTNSVIDPSLALTPTNPSIDPSTLSTVKSKEVINLASFNFTNPPSTSSSSGNSPKSNSEPLPASTESAIATLRKYGLGSCGPPGFYGTIDVHLELERAIASFLGTEASIIYSQSFSTASSVIPAFCKRGDVIVADRGINFVIQKGLQLSRSTIRWYDHNCLRATSSPSALVPVLEQLEKEFKRKKMPLTRRFIVTEGLFSDSGSLTDLPVLIGIAKKFKYRIILDESFSIGTLGRTGRGLTELFNVPAEEVDMIIGASFPCCHHNKSHKV
jgi:serine palmitoyltransferase